MVQPDRGLLEANWWGLADGGQQPMVHPEFEVELELELELELKFDFGLETEREEVRSKEKSI
jgi:hypothetical protein